MSRRRSEGPRIALFIVLLGTMLIGCGQPSSSPRAPQQPQASSEAYEFKGGYPTPKTMHDAYEVVDLNRAVRVSVLLSDGVRRRDF